MCVRSRITAVGALGFAAALTGSAAGAQGLPEITVERFVLANGLTVIVHENRARPVAHVRMFYDVAEKDARAGEHGHAHLFEHLALGRTADLDRSIREFLAAIGAQGADATSQFDFTHYFATVPAAAVDTVIWMEAQRMARLVPALTDADLERARGEVIAEESHLLRHPPVAMLKVIWEHTYPEGHPYARFDVASEDVKRATLADARHFYARWYHPRMRCSSSPEM